MTNRIQMSRWRDDLVVVPTRKPGEQGTLGNESQTVQPLRLKVEATVIVHFRIRTALKTCQNGEASSTP